LDRLIPSTSLIASGNMLPSDNDLVSSSTGTKEGSTSSRSTNGTVT
jgi:hypothetical protein